MRYLVWIIRLAVFVVILLFALKNTEGVNVRFFADYTLSDVPLIVVMLVMMVLGSILGWLVTLPSLLRYRRDAARLKREKQAMQENLGKNNVGTNPTVS